MTASTFGRQYVGGALGGGALRRAAGEQRGVAAGSNEGVVLTVYSYDVLGWKVASLAEGSLGAGHHEAVLEADRLAPGTYVLRLTAGEQVRTMRGTIAR